MCWDFFFFFFFCSLSSDSIQCKVWRSHRTIQCSRRCVSWHWLARIRWPVDFLSRFQTSFLLFILFNKLWSEFCIIHFRLYWMSFFCLSKVLFRVWDSLVSNGPLKFLIMIISLLSFMHWRYSTFELWNNWSSSDLFILSCEHFLYLKANQYDSYWFVSWHVDVYFIWLF
jgi:hypothetical protein